MSIWKWRGITPSHHWDGSQSMIARNMQSSLLVVSWASGYSAGNAGDANGMAAPCAGKLSVEKLDMQLHAAVHENRMGTDKSGAARLFPTTPTCPRMHLQRASRAVSR